MNQIISPDAFGRAPYPDDHRASGVKALLDAGAINGPIRKGPRRFWTTTEIKTLKAVYADGGLAACIAALPGRSASSIYQRANQEGLRVKNAQGTVSERHVWTTTPQIDDAIRRVFAGAPKNDAIKRLSVTLGRPRQWISSRALQLGLKVPTFKEPDWSEAELDLLREHGAKHPQTVRRILRRAGFKRTAVAIHLKAKRLHIARERLDDDRLYSARGLGEAFGLSGDTISSWIAKGWLKAKRRAVETGSDDVAEWVIHRNDIRDFVVDNVSLVDFRKVDKFWLVDLLNERAWESRE